MPSLHRIQWIDESIRNREYPNSARVAEVFEISRRQALRDFEYLRDSLGAPLEYCPVRKGFYYREESFSVPGFTMTASQKDLIASLASHYEALSNNAGAASDSFIAIAQLLSRLSGQKNVSALPQRFLPNGIVPFRAVLSSESANPAVIPTSLQPFFRGVNEQRKWICEFYESPQFIAALLGSGVTFTILFPNWLREKFVSHVDHLRRANQM